MKILHTADWHLGIKHNNEYREKEQQVALDWLAETILAQKIELLIVAGDIFDTELPPNFARRQYYGFLTKLVNSSCKDVVIIAGNHDSANYLDTSGDLLKLLNVHVVGNLPEDIQEQLVFIRSGEELKAIVAAVPYLRDRDLGKTQSGQSREERIAALNQGIEEHYQNLAEILKPYRSQDIPIITTGHLFVSGGDRDGRNNIIHMGTLDLIAASAFPDLFDYVALGHLHRPQKVAGLDHIRYSGSMIPLDFNEINYNQVVLALQFKGRKLQKVKSLEVPLWRKLKYYEGTVDYIKEKLINLEVKEEGELWLKLLVETDSYFPAMVEEFNDLIVGKNARIVVFNQTKDLEKSDYYGQQKLMQNLTELTPNQVFEMRMDEKEIIDPEKRKELMDTFQELLNWMQDKDQV